MIKAIQGYFDAAVKPLLGQPIQWEEYRLARKNSIVALANLSETFQRMLSEPEQANHAQLLHQFVVASHTITGHIAALSSIEGEEIQQSSWIKEIGHAIDRELLLSAKIFNQPEPETGDGVILKPPDQSTLPANLLMYIYSTARDIKGILVKMKTSPV
jgi:hypothetical protein